MRVEAEGDLVRIWDGSQPERFTEVLRIAGCGEHLLHGAFRCPNGRSRAEIPERENHVGVRDVEQDNCGHRIGGSVVEWWFAANVG